MRADAQKNYDHLLAVAHNAVTEQGADASMRDIARRAEVGLATLFRHFPTREALFEALLHKRVDSLVRQADDLEKSVPADEALMAWFRQGMSFVHTYNGVCTLLARAHADPNSALYAASMALRSAGSKLLLRAQNEGLARTDIDGEDVFALMSALGWLEEQPSLATRADRIFEIVAGAILTIRPSKPSS